MSMTDFLFICSIKSPQCTDKYSKKTLFDSDSPPDSPPDVTMMSQSFPVSCWWSLGFVPNRKWNFTFLVHQNTERKPLSNKIFAILTSTLLRFNRANKIKKIGHIHFKKDQNTVAIVFFFVFCVSDMSWYLSAYCFKL